MWLALADSLSLVCTAAGLVRYGGALWWVPRHDPVFQPQRWLLWMGLSSLVVLGTLDLLEDTGLALALQYGPEGRRLITRSWALLAIVGFYGSYLRCLRQLPRRPEV